MPDQEEEMNRFFVYGTLRPGQQRWPVLEYVLEKPPERAELRGAALYNAGSYPFVLPTDNINDVVYGELITVRKGKINQTRQQLDDIEGYVPGDQHSLFLRKKVNVLLPEGFPVEDGWVDAFVYIGGNRFARYVRDNYGFRRIESGDWTKR